MGNVSRGQWQQDKDGRAGSSESHGMLGFLVWRMHTDACGHGGWQGSVAMPQPCKVHRAGGAVLRVFVSGKLCIHSDAGAGLSAGDGEMPRPSQTWQEEPKEVLLS